mgnify:CR=1 FL=1
MRGYASVTAFFVVLIIFLLWLNSAVSNYNDKLPETIAQRFYISVFKNTDTDKILELSGKAYSEFDSQEDIKAFIKNSFEDKTSMTSVFCKKTTKRFVYYC